MGFSYDANTAVGWEIMLEGLKDNKLGTGCEEIMSEPEKSRSSSKQNT